MTENNVIVPDENQQRIYQVWETTDSNILLHAVAGSGKTTTLLGLVSRVQWRTLFLAFNKSIQEEVSAKLEALGHRHAKAMTIHALGFAAIRQHFGKVKVNGNKGWELISMLEKANKSFYKRLSWKEKYKVNMTILSMDEASRLYFTEDVEEIYEAMATMDKFYYDFPELEDLWKEFLEIRKNSYHTGCSIDFIDMVFYPVQANLYIPVEPFYLLIDEAQDLNLCQHLFIEQLIAQGNIIKWAAVGDTRQSIYGFGGSFSNSFQRFKEKPNVVELPLTVCYRCPLKIVREANKVYDVMTGFKTEEGYIGYETDASRIKEGSLIICRNSYPLFYLYFQLLANKKRAYIKGEEILAGIIRFLKPYNKMRIDSANREMMKDLREWESVKDTSKEARYRYFKFRENYQIFEVLSKSIKQPYASVEELLLDLQSIFLEGSEENTIILSTIHKSKGLEHPVVYILNEDLIPNPYAETDAQLEQEENLRYVARTRATKELHYLNINIK